MCRMTGFGITVYGCDPDEARLVRELAPTLGISATITSAAVSEVGVISVPRNRCISVGHRSELSAPVLRALADAGVEHVSTRSIGLDHIDLRAAEAARIAVENVVYAADGVADYTLMLILMAIRDAREVLGAVERHDFRLGRARGRDLRDMTVGVIGVGHIGGAVVTRLRAFGCRVLANNDGRAVDTAAELATLDVLLRESDVVTLHVPLNAETHHFIGRAQIAAMKPGAILVNTGRGALVDTGALIAALENGKLGGAALDVLEGEEGIFASDRGTNPIGHPYLPRLLRLPNAVITPHSAYYTERTLRDTVEQTLLKCVRFERTRLNAEARDRDPVRRMFRRA